MNGGKTIKDKILLRNFSPVFTFEKFNYECQDSKIISGLRIDRKWSEHGEREEKVLTQKSTTKCRQSLFSFCWRKFKSKDRIFPKLRYDHTKMIHWRPNCPCFVELGAIQSAIIWTFTKSNCLSLVHLFIYFSPPAQIPVPM